MKLQAISLFAGCGGSDLGMKLAGINPIWANEIDSHACDFYERVTGSSSIENCDIRQIGSFPDADIVVGCYPCQGFSKGGRRKSDDDRNYLYREFDRALRQVKPLAFIVENVDAMGFRQNQQLFRNQITRFRFAGYKVSHQVLNAKDYGLAQDRRRIFIVGIRSDLNRRFIFPEVTHDDQNCKRKTLRDVIGHLPNPSPSDVNDQELHWYYLSRNRRRTWDQQSHCIVANARHVTLHPSSPPLKRIGPDHWEFSTAGQHRRFSVQECALLQGFPSPEVFASDNLFRRYRAIGNAVPPPLFAAVARQLKKIIH